jgi:predicted short-subunit dehydrogenase-like oxidoreductase (DUF2520 family)
MDMPSVRIVGPGRAGTSLARALERAGWQVREPVRRGGDPSAAGHGVDLVVIATPDAIVDEVAQRIEPDDHAVVAHLAGALTLEALSPHVRRASMHPLRSIPRPDTSLVGAWFAVAGDPLAGLAVADVGGRPIAVDDERRVEYHAAAVVASNHLVALLGQVERLAAPAGVPLAAYLDLVRGTVDNVEALGPENALTGPVRRGDWETVALHLEVIDESERAAYQAMADAAARLVP